MKTTNKKLSISSLLDAVRHGREEEIRNSLKSQGLPANAKKTTDYTVLQMAVKRNKTSIVQLLIDAGCTINPPKSNSGLSPLAVAVKNGNLDIATLLLEKGANLEISNQSDINFLHLASEEKSLKMLKAFYKYGIDINVIENSKTPFQVFFESSLPYTQLDDSNNVEIFKWFLLKGASIHIHHDWSVLHFVCTTNHKDIIQMLLKVSKNVNQINAEGNTCLHILLEQSSLNDLDVAEIIELFMMKGAEVNIANNKEDTVYHLAARKKYLKTINMLLRNELDINSCDNNGNTILHNILENSASLSKDDLFHEVVSCIMNTQSFKFLENNEGKSPLHLVIENNHMEILYDMVLRPEFDMNFHDTSGNTVLHLILNSCLNADSCDATDLIDVVSVLLRTDISVLSKNNNGETPLHLAAKNRYYMICIILLQHGADPTALDYNGNSMLHFLSMLSMDTQNEVELVSLFVGQGCNVNEKNKLGQTPLILSAQFGSTMITRSLLQNNAKLNCSVDENLSTPLHIAAGSNHFGIVEELIKYGIDVNLQRKDGSGALHLSASHKECTVTRILLENGADIALTNKTGKTALHIACWNNSLDNINELLNHGADINVEDQFQTIPFMLIHNSPECFTALYNHTVKLQAADLMVSQLMEKCIEEYELAHKNDPSVFMANELFDSALTEIEQIIDTEIGENFDLVHMLHMTPKDFDLVNNNQDIQQFIYSDGFDEEFPLYGNLIRGLYAKNIMRTGLIVSAKDGFKEILGLTLEDPCYDKIFSYLNNQDLRHLKRAEKIKLSTNQISTKRKRLEVTDKSHTAGPVKRFRSIKKEAVKRKLFEEKGEPMNVIPPLKICRRYSF